MNAPRNQSHRKPQHLQTAHDPDHDADHDHQHGHGDHEHSHSTNTRMLAWSLALTVGFMLVESVSGWLARSLALLADAGHMLTDSAALGLALVAAYFAKRAPDAKRSYGYHRLQVLATFVNGMALLLIVGWIAFEAVQKLLDPQPVNARLMLPVAILGGVVNVVVFFILRRGDHGDMNIAAATLHVLGDLLGSIGAVVAALVILSTQWTPIDPLLSVLLCGLIVRSAWALVRRSTHILLEGAPDWLDVAALRDMLIEHVPGIKDVHHVHCWSLSPRETLLTLHATVNANADHNAVLREAHHELAEHYGITHATIQLECGPCVDEGCG